MHPPHANFAGSAMSKHQRRWTSAEATSGDRLPEPLLSEREQREFSNSCDALAATEITPTCSWCSARSADIDACPGPSPRMLEAGSDSPVEPVSSCSVARAWAAVCGPLSYHRGLLDLRGVLGRICNQMVKSEEQLL